MPSVVTSAKQAELQRRMESLGISPADLTETFIRGSGKGGQKINKTSSCVQLHHHPSGIEIRCQRERSQALNRFLARRELCDKLEALRDQKKSARAREAARIRKQKQRRSRRTKAKILEAKAQNSQKKALRKKIFPSW